MTRTSADKKRVVRAAALCLPCRQFFVRVTVLEAFDPLPGNSRIVLQLIIVEILK